MLAAVSGGWAPEQLVIRSVIKSEITQRGLDDASSLGLVLEFPPRACAQAAHDQIPNFLFGHLARHVDELVCEHVILLQDGQEEDLHGVRALEAGGMVGRVLVLVLLEHRPR